MEIKNEVNLPPIKSVAAQASRRTAYCFGAATIVVGILGLGAMTVYGLGPDRPVAVVVAHALPFPAALVGHHLITMGEYFDARAAHLTYAKAFPSPSTSPVPSNVLASLIDERLIEDIGARLNVKTDPSVVQAMLASAEKNAGGESELTTQVQSLFGWSVQTYQAEVLAPAAYAQQVNQSVLSNASLQAAAQGKAQEALARLTTGESFASVADAFNQPGSTLGEGGDIGFVQTSDMPLDWVSALDGLKDGDHTGVLDESDRFTILSVDAVVDTDTNTGDHLSAIEIPKNALPDILATERTHTFVWEIPNAD